MTHHVDALARHLALLLSIGELSGRIAPGPDEAAVLADLAAMARRATRSDRVSLFEIDGADADEGASLHVVRVARDVAVDDGVAPVATYAPRHTALLLAPLGALAVEAMCPVSREEPLYARHLDVEPLVPRSAAYAPIVAFGKARGVLELARSAVEPFRGDDLRAVEQAARAIAAGVYGARREATIASLLTSLLPELLEPSRAPTSLPERVRASGAQAVRCQDGAPCREQERWAWAGRWLSRDSVSAHPSLRTLAPRDSPRHVIARQGASGVKRYAAVARASFSLQLLSGDGAAAVRRWWRRAPLLRVALMRCSMLPCSRHPTRVACTSM